MMIKNKEMEFTTYPKVLRVGSPRADESIEDMEGEVYIQEKMDGANCRFQRIDDSYLYFGSKTQYWKLNRQNPSGDKKDIGSMYTKAVEKVLFDTQWERLAEIEEEYNTTYTFYAENMVLHNLDYNWDQTDQLYFFDVYDEEANEFLHPEKASRIVEEIGHQFVPHYEVGKAEEIDFENFELPESHFRGGKPEGVVFKNPKTGIKKKEHREDFQEINGYTFGNMRGNSDEDRLVNDYCSNNRIIKVLQKEVVENDRELTMKDMMGEANVHLQVLEDMWTEEVGNIVHKNWEIDLRKVKKMVTRRTRKVLKRRISIKERNEIEDIEALSLRWD